MKNKNKASAARTCKYSLAVPPPRFISASEVVNELAEWVQVEVYSNIERDGVVRDPRACASIHRLHEAIRILMTYCVPEKLDPTLAPFLRTPER